MSDFRIKDGVLTEYTGPGGNVIVPEGVTKIGDNAFEDCSGLTSITLPEGLTAIGEHAFWVCRGLTSIKLPEGLTVIGEWAFYSCRRLTSITLPEGLTEIGVGAFSDCSGLTSITLPEGLTAIGECAFYDCSGLTSIALPEGLTKIGRYAFYGCSSLTSITLPEGLKEIGFQAFYGCSSLTSITLPEGLTEIDESAFLGCSGLTMIAGPEVRPEKYVRVCKATVEGWYAAARVFVREEADTITLPETVIDINEDALWDWLSQGWSRAVRVANAELLKRLLAISKLTGRVLTGSMDIIVVEPTVLRLPMLLVNPIFDRLMDYAQSHDMPEAVAQLLEARHLHGAASGDDDERLCGLLVADKYEKGVGMSDFEIRDGVLVNYRGVCGDVVVPKGLTEIGGHAFADCSGLTSITLPESLKKIGGGAFEGCRALTSITLPKGLAEIGYGAFGDCSGLTSITLPEGVFASCEAFHGCETLTILCAPKPRGRGWVIDYYYFEVGSYREELCDTVSFKRICEARIRTEDEERSVDVYAYWFDGDVSGVSLGYGEEFAGWNWGHAHVGCYHLITLPEQVVWVDAKALARNLAGAKYPVRLTVQNAELLVKLFDTEPALEKLLEGSIQQLLTDPDILRKPERLREPVFGVLMDYAQTHDMPEAVAVLLQARHEVGLADDGDELEL